MKSFGAINKIICQNQLAILNMITKIFILYTNYTNILSNSVIYKISSNRQIHFQIETLKGN